MKRCLIVFLLVTTGSLARCAGPESPAASPKPKPTAALSGPSDEDKALAAGFLAISKSLTHPQAIEPLNWGGREEMRRRAAMLAGEIPATAQQLAEARRTLSWRSSALSKAKHFGKPKALVMGRAAGPIKIDGHMDEAAWQQAPPITEFYRVDSPTLLHGPATEFRMLWDERNLYFFFTCEDKSIEARKFQRDEPVYTQDCVELFLMPSLRWGMYWELNVSPSDSLLDVLHCKYRRQWGSYARPDQSVEGLQFATAPMGPAGKPTGYTVEIAFPLDQLPGGLGEDKDNRTLYLLATRVDKTGNSNVYAAFAPVAGWFHNIWCYCPVRLVQ